MTADHPTAEQLRAYASGSLDDGGAAIEGHLADCDTCWSVVEEFDAATAVARLLRSLPAERLRSLANSDEEVSEGENEPKEPEPPAELLDHPRYRLLGFVGAGGMGQVWKARHELMNRLVAIKTIRPDLLRDEKAVARFRYEVEAAAVLDHPGIVRAFDAERVGDLHFLVMEYVEGVDLARLVNERGPLPMAEACGSVPCPSELCSPAAPYGRGVRVRPAGRGWPRLRPQARHGPPRHQAAQPAPHATRPGQDQRFWSGVVTGRSGGVEQRPQAPGGIIYGHERVGDAAGRRLRHARLHRSRADQGRQKRR
jgi:hypothetical protein